MKFEPKILSIEVIGKDGTAKITYSDYSEKIVNIKKYLKNNQELIKQKILIKMNPKLKTDKKALEFKMGLSAKLDPIVMGILSDYPRNYSNYADSEAINGFYPNDAIKTIYNLKNMDKSILSHDEQKNLINNLLRRNHLLVKKDPFFINLLKRLKASEILKNISPKRNDRKSIFRESLKSTTSSVNPHSRNIVSKSTDTLVKEER